MRVPPVSADQVEKGKEIDPDKIHKMPVEAGDFNG
jgi:hypothetical protein